MAKRFLSVLVVLMLILATFTVASAEKQLTFGYIA